MLQFGPYLLDPAARLLRRDGQTVHLAPKACEVLALLARHAGEVVTKESIFAAVWPGVTVEEGNLTQQISLLRKTLGPAPGGGLYIETIPKTGYRFLVPVAPLAPHLPPRLVRRILGAVLAAALLGFWIGRATASTLFSTPY